MTDQETLDDEYYDEMWYKILDDLASIWVMEGRQPNRGLELAFKLGPFRSNKGKTEYVASIREKYGFTVTIDTNGSEHKSSHVKQICLFLK